MSQLNIVLANLTHSLVNHIHLNLLCRKLDERVGECLDRTIHIALHHKIEFLEVAKSNTTTQLVKSQTSLSAQALFTLQLFTLITDFTSLLIRIHHMEGVTCSRSTIQTEDNCWFSRECLLYALATLVEHSL